MKCMNCKFWSVYKDSLEFARCNRLDEEEDLKDPHVMVYIYSDYSVHEDGFYTRAGFGCVLFQEKGEVQP